MTRGREPLGGMKMCLQSPAPDAHPLAALAKLLSWYNDLVKMSQELVRSNAIEIDL